MKGRNWPNLLIAGDGYQEFGKLFSALAARELAWSSAIDKHGNWIISTTDDPDLDDIMRIAASEGIGRIDVFSGGELTSFDFFSLMKEHGIDLKRPIVKANVGGDW